MRYWDKRGEQMVEASIVLPVVILVIKWDNTNSPVVRTISESRDVRYANIGLAGGLLRKSIEVTGFSVCEDKLVRAGGVIEEAVKK